ncbi:TldD/PmbA family protein [Haloplasma contractile]|uniref:TldD protein n=1 Tax=Haloplasma contractile SSD-17B TaxID=1033810 RepID=U2FFA6_9MOLU|nr:TldD/PmbA family protein [Haloplasma contractile]ERJ11595.1 TldD protein [Haloplasma contractile SSD-17B]
MISKKHAKKVLKTCLITGGDFAEIFAEDTIKNQLELSGGEISKTNTSNIYGAGIRILRGTQEVYGYTNDTSLEGLTKLAKSLAKSFDFEPIKAKVKVKEEVIKNKHTIKIDPSITPNEEKVKYLNEVYEVAKDYHEHVSQVIASLVDTTQKVLIINTEGKMVHDTRCNVRLGLQVVASKDGDMQVGRDSLGRNQGLEVFDESDLQAFAKEVAKSAITMLSADEIEGQVMPVVIHNAFGGVILHEACVHSLEATSVAKGVSVFSNKLGEKIASDIVTAVDDGTLENSWGSLNVDDEGTKTQRNVLIENGILKSYLVDKRNARKMDGHPITGSGRRQSYRFSPTSRMTNTFFTNGDSTFEEIIESTEYGLFAKKMGGGSVNPATGEFNFAVSEAYMIENGKITRPIKGATLIGSGAEVLKKVDMIGNNLTYGHGMCGSISGSIPTDVGQPTIRVSGITVGGRGGKN